MAIFGEKETSGETADPVSEDQGGEADDLTTPSASPSAPDGRPKKSKASGMAIGNLVIAFDYRMWRPGLAIVLEVLDRKLGVLRLHVFKDQKINCPGISDGEWSPENSQTAVRERRWWRVIRSDD